MSISRALSEEEQRVIADWLASLSPLLAELYDSFNVLLAAETMPGRVRLIGHCIRELRIKLIAHFVADQADRIDYVKEVRAIGARLRENGGIGASFDPEANSDIPSATEFLIDATTTGMIVDLVRRSEAKTDFLLNQIVELLRQLRIDPQGPTGSLKPIASRFREISETYQFAHTDKTDAELLNDGFIERVNEFDRYLFSFASSRRFVEGLGALDDILADANRRAS